jgi:hypothetical protein
VLAQEEVDMTRRIALVALFAVATLSSSSASSGAQVVAPATRSAAAVSPTATLDTTAKASCGRVVVAAGDFTAPVDGIAATGRLAVAQAPSAVLHLGDNAYESGTLTEFRTQIGSTPWASLLAVTYPTPGNHEYRTPGAAGYFAFYGSPPPYYATDLGCGWRAYSLDSEIALAAQVTWLTSDLKAHPGASVVAFWHRPRWSSGEHGGATDVDPLWKALAGRKAIVLAGHDHDYERFRARDGGLREFVVGTGGSQTRPFRATQPGSAVRITGVPGILRLSLKGQGGYSWAFLDTTGKVRDSGTRATP